MPQKSSHKRYLLNVPAGNIAHRFTDVVVLGSGAAGLRAAIEAAQNLKVVVVSKQAPSETNTYYAQGGVAAVLAKNDSVDEHIRDTLKAGCGLCDKDAVSTIVSEGPECIKELAEWGAAFDMDGDNLAFTREGGHQRALIIHAHGDATGNEIMNTMLRKARSFENILWLENTFAIDLLTEDKRCRGVLINHGGELSAVWAKQVIMATGGCGRLYRETTNPEIATGDGLSMAWRAGAVLANMEMVQFHPTTLYVAGATRALISEAVRGEGGVLTTKDGHAFMQEYDPAGDLAPRDIVSRAILTEMKRTGETNVYLDLSAIDAAKLKKRFPNIRKLCASFDIDITRNLIPVRPSAHYMIGGIKTDLDGRTSMRNLLAAGEVAATGFHGANRLGSNSLLEGIVMGRRAGRKAIERAQQKKKDVKPVSMSGAGVNWKSSNSNIDLEDVQAALRSLMWRSGGIVRNELGLSSALKKVLSWQSYVLSRQFGSPEAWEVQNLLTLAEIVLRSALMRQESRGVHYRSDFAKTDNEHWQKSTVIKMSPDSSGERK